MSANKTAVATFNETTEFGKYSSSLPLPAPACISLDEGEEMVKRNHRKGLASLSHSRTGLCGWGWHTMVLGHNNTAV